MKKEIILPVAAWVCGLAGFGLRRWELAQAYDPNSRLMMAHPAHWLLCALMAGLLLASVFGCRGMGKRPGREWFYAPEGIYMPLCVCAGLVLLMAGGIGLWEQLHTGQPDLLGRIAWVACILGGGAVVLFTRRVFRGLWSDHAPIPLMLTCFALVLWLICLYQQHARQPEVRLFVWQVLSGVAMVLGLYGLVTLALDRGSAARSCVAGLMSIALAPVALADGMGLAMTLVWIFGAVYFTAHSYLLLRDAFGRPWPERMPLGAQDEEQTEDEG